MTVISTLTGIDLKKLVGRRHPEYDQNLSHWNLAEAAYRGGRDWFEMEVDGNKNLFQFYKEGEEEYKDRKNRTHRANHTRRVVDTVNQYLFRSPPVRDEKKVPSYIKSFWENTAGPRRSIQRFVKELDRWASTMGRVYVVIDRPAHDEAQATRRRKDEKSPYAYIVFPQYVLDMAYGDDGKFDWILIAEDYRDESGGLDDGGEMRLRYRLWTRSHWFLIVEDEDTNGKSVKKDKNYVIQDEGQHGLGIVPVIEVDDQEGSRWSAPGLCSDIIYMDRTLVNYGSLLDEILYEQTFSQLTMPADAILPGTTEYGQMVAAAKSRIFLFSATSPGVKPEFISPDAAQAELIMKAMSDLKRDIYSVTGTDNDANSQSMSTGKSYASGKVREFDHTQIENILLDKARSLELTEDRMLEVVAAWMNNGKERIEPDWVVYPDKFDIRGLAAELDIAAELNELEAPTEIMRRQMRTIVDKNYPRMTDKEKEDFYKVINEWFPSYMVERAFKQEELDVRLFTAETQADAMDRDGVIGNKEFEDKSLKDGKRNQTGKEIKAGTVQGVNRKAAPSKTRSDQ